MLLMRAPVRALIIADDPPACAEILSRQLLLAGLETISSFAASEGEYLRQLLIGVDVVVWHHAARSLSIQQAINIPLGRHLDVPVIVVGTGLNDAQLLDYVRLGVTDVIHVEPFTRLGSSVER